MKRRFNIHCIYLSLCKLFDLEWLLSSRFLSWNKFLLRLSLMRWINRYGLALYSLSKAIFWSLGKKTDACYLNSSVRNKHSFNGYNQKICCFWLMQTKRCSWFLISWFNAFPVFSPLKLYYKNLYIQYWGKYILSVQLWPIVSLIRSRWKRSWFYKAVAVY